jgi:tetratricopeptide (TPR) repeat protein
VKIETVVILVAVAFLVGLVVGVVGMAFKTAPGTEVRQMSPVTPVEVPSGPVGFSQDIEMLEKLAQEDSDNPEVWVRLGDAFYQSQQYDKAVEAYTKAIGFRPDSKDLLTKLGNAHFDKGDFGSAIEAYSKVLEKEPNNADVLTDLGIAHRRSGSPEKAVEAFRRAAQIDGSHLNSRYNLGVVLFHDLNDREGAIEAWEDFLLAGPPPDRVDQVSQMIEALKNMAPGE